MEQDSSPTNIELISNEEAKQLDFEFRMSLIVGITFSISFLVGLIGNMMVLLTILFQRKMRSRTNLLILNLAVASLIFIILCVPSTGLNYVLSVWYFGDIGCRISQYASYVTTYMIIFLLIILSLDRYVAVKSLKTNRSEAFNKFSCIGLWITVLILNIPHLFLHSQYEYNLGTEKRTVCILKYGSIVMNPNQTDEAIEMGRYKIQIYYLTFFLFAYLIPIISLIIIYAIIMKKLIRAKGQQLNKNKKRITLMVIAVVASFILCWTPLQIMFFLQHVVRVQFTELHALFLILSNCIAYSNACVNPIIYGFANENFRAAYLSFLQCDFRKRNSNNFTKDERSEYQVKNRLCNPSGKMIAMMKIDNVKAEDL